MHVHNDGPDCLGCDTKLKCVNPILVDWFNNNAKRNYPTIHIAWGYRDEESQNQAVSTGMSQLRFPNSAHNKSDTAGNPCSDAIDLFVQFKGKASWPTHLFYDIAKQNQKFILWGGDWPNLGDFDHFQIKRAPPK